MQICGAVYVGKLCKKRASIVCEMVLNSGASHIPPIYNMIKDSEVMRKDREKKNRSRARQFQRGYAQQLR
jgi:Asp-tRNA(Asn)/Glu-tRNA(Gln) amidotransferase C subunit